MYMVVLSCLDDHHPATLYVCAALAIAAHMALQASYGGRLSMSQLHVGVPCSLAQHTAQQDAPQQVSCRAQDVWDQQPGGMHGRKEC